MYSIPFGAGREKFLAGEFDSASQFASARPQVIMGFIIWEVVADIDIGEKQV